MDANAGRPLVDWDGDAVAGAVDAVEGDGAEEAAVADEDGADGHGAFDDFDFARLAAGSEEDLLRDAGGGVFAC